MSKMKKIIAVFAVLVTVVAAGFAIAASTITAGKTVEATAATKFMATASTTGKVVGTLAKGTTAVVSKVSKDWAYIKLTNSGLYGWVKSSSLKIITVKPALTVTTVSKISAEWAASGHANTTNEPFAYAGPNKGCAPCHSGNGLEKWGTDKPYDPSGVTSTTVNGVSVRQYDPTKVELPSPIGCATCHSGNGAAIMTSGKVPATLNVYSGKTTELAVGNKNALCLSCHNGRRDAQSYFTSWTTPGATKTTSYPHHAWGAVVSGKGGQQYPGVTYAQSTTHQSMGCIGCHMATNKAGYVSHTFKPEIATCQKCHVGATDFELTGTALAGKLKKELEEKKAKLEQLILAKFPAASKIGTDNSTAPLVMKATNAKITSAELQTVPTEVLVGCYNYAIVEQELTLGAKGAHNPKYIRALLDESIKKLEALQ